MCSGNLYIFGNGSNVYGLNGVSVRFVSGWVVDVIGVALETKWKWREGPKGTLVLSRLRSDSLVH